MRWSVFVAILLTLCFFSPRDASAGKNKGNRITVGPSGQFATIQEGVDAALDGDRILVEEGTYNESVVISGRKNLTLSGARNNTNIIGTTSHAIAVGAGGGLSTLSTQDDTQVLPLGQGTPSVTCVDTGADGICDTTASGDDAQLVPLGQGAPDTTCVSAGMDGVLDTLAGVNDDVVDAGANLITAGPDGVCDTTADPADDQTIPVGDGAADRACVDTGADGICDATATGDDDQRIPVGQGLPSSNCVGQGPNGEFETPAAGDDTIRASLFGEFITSGPDGICDSLALTGDDVVETGLEEITSGPNGICETAAGTDETQAIPVGNGEPDSNCVTAGFDGTLDTAVASGDDVLDVAGTRITSGPDGVCDTTADANDFQVLPVGQGLPGTVCVTADNPLVKGRNVKIQNFGLRAPNGFDGIHVERNDFVQISKITADGSLGPGGLPATGRFGIFVDFRSVKPDIKSSTARLWSDSGFAIQGPGAKIVSCTADLNGDFGFLQQDTGVGALFINDTARGNGIGGFGIGGPVNILQRCIAQDNATAGFVMAGAGSILFQVTSSNNMVGVRAFAPGTRVRSSVISNNLDKGIILQANPDGSGRSAVGSEVFMSTIENNRNAGIEVGVFGIIIKRNQIGPRKLTGSGRQDVGVHLNIDARGTLLEDNKIQNNFDVDGDLCAPAGAICDLVDDGSNNAGKKNGFTPGSSPPPGFE